MANKIYKRNCNTCDECYEGSGKKYCSHDCAYKSEQWIGKKNVSKRSDVKMKIAKSKMRENNPNWRGGVSKKNALVRASAPYREWRTAVFERDDYTCQECGDRNGNGHNVRLHADHIKPFSKHPELRLDINNGRTLCKDCHKKTETYGVRLQYQS